MVRMLFWNDGFRFDGWFERKTAIMQAFSCTIPTDFSIFSIGGEGTDGSVVIASKQY